MHSLLYFLFSIIVLVQASPELEHPLARFWAFTCVGQLGTPQEKCRQAIKNCHKMCFGDACEKCVLNVEVLCQQCVNDLKKFDTASVTVNGQSVTALTDMDRFCTQDNAEICIFACHLKLQVEGNCMPYAAPQNNRCICDIAGSSTITNPFAGFLTDVNGVNLVNLIGFPSNTRWSLLYQGSRDGFSSASFHAKCDNAAKTLTIVNSVFNYTFGGYTEQTWDSSNTYKKDPNAFVYSLINRNNIPYKFSIRSGSPDAIFCQLASGPKFGGPNNFDIAIAHEANLNAASFSELGSNYNINAQAAALGVTGTFLGGAFQFGVSDIAVYRML
jgi:hypothetical protein